MMSDPFKILLKTATEKPIHKEQIGLVEKSGKYRLAPAVRPSIRHDNGHLDVHPKRDPTFADHAKRKKWIIQLEASEAACTSLTGKYIGICSNEDLSDANLAYWHFLFGKGADRQVDYERFLKNDPSAVNLVDNLTSDFKKHAEIIGVDRVKFSVTSEAYTVGMGGISTYPFTANWQKTLGAHFLWVSANISVSADHLANICYDAELTIHVEDRYNFNPGAKDIATGIPDSENGIFEITGLASQYTQFAKVTRILHWKKGKNN